MATPDPPAPYRVVYSQAVQRRLNELSAEAIARGDGEAFAAAYAEFDRRLRLYPQFGDPQFDMVVGGGQIRLGIVRPLSMRYGVNEDLRIVFCAAPPTLLPLDEPEAESGG